MSAKFSIRVMTERWVLLGLLAAMSLVLSTCIVAYADTTIDETDNAALAEAQADNQPAVQAKAEDADKTNADKTDGDKADTDSGSGASGSESADAPKPADTPAKPELKPTKVGWMKDKDGTWYYFKSVSGAPATGWLYVGGAWYYLDPSKNGAMATGKYTDGKAHYISNANGAMYASRWVKLGPEWFYATGSGALKTGWLYSGGQWYWLDAAKEARMAANEWVTDAGKKYYLTASGAMAKGWVKIGSDWYFANGSGAKQQSGWVYSGSKWYWLDKDNDGKMAASKWISDKNKSYYLASSGAMATGWVKVGPDWFYTDRSGAKQQAGWVYSGSKWYWLDKDNDGKMAVNKWITDKNKRYYLTDKGPGAMATGWFKIGSDWYYADSSGAQKQNGWVYSGSKWYWLQGDLAGDERGKMLASARKSIEGKDYAFDSNGAMYANAVVDLDEGKVGYATSSGAITPLGVRENGKVVLQDSKGNKLTGWQKVGGAWFYGDQGGVAHTGWLELSNKWYWMDSNGVMATGIRTIDGKTCVFTSSGMYVPVSAAHAATFERAIAELAKCTNDSMTKEQKLRAAFDHIRDHFTECNPRVPHMKANGWETIYANDIFIDRRGNCLSYAAAFAFMAKAIGYENVYACNYGHAWAEIDGRIYDPEWESNHRSESYFNRAINAPGGPGYTDKILDGNAWHRVKI